MEVFSSYAPDRAQPLGSYAALVAAYNLALGGLLLADGRRRVRLPERLGAFDLVLLGLATHKLSRTIAKSRVVSPFRAPFVEYQGSATGGEVDERVRGEGPRRALGELVTCPYCVGHWAAGTLVAGLAVRPRAARAVTAIFAAVAVSDFLHRLYTFLRSRDQVAGAAARAARARKGAAASGALESAARTSAAGASPPVPR